MEDIPAIEGGKPVREKPIEVYPVFTEEEINAVVETLRSGKLTSLTGNKTKIFEEEFSKYLGVKHSIAVMNGTVALHVALRALGIGPGDEVITSPFTFVASASSILHQNAIPVFADIEKDTFNISPESIAERITDKTKAIIAVHLCGHPAEMDEIKKIAEEHNLRVIEDCAQAIGAEYRGVKVGGIGDVGTFSFYLSKNITTGEGGMVTTNNDEVAEKAKLIRHHGEPSWYRYILLGYNYRMTELQAALGIEQLKRLDELNRRREEIAKIYTDEFEGVDTLILPIVRPHVKHVWHLYNVILDIDKIRISRNEFVKAVRAENVWINIVYPSVLYLEPLFMNKSGHGKGCPWSCPFYGRNIEYKKGLCPNAEWVSERVITLPTLPYLSDEHVIDIAKAVKKVAKFYTK